MKFKIQLNLPIRYYEQAYDVEMDRYTLCGIFGEMGRMDCIPKKAIVRDGGGGQECFLYLMAKWQGGTDYEILDTYAHIERWDDTKNPPYWAEIYEDFPLPNDYLDPNVKYTYDRWDYVTEEYRVEEEDSTAMGKNLGEFVTIGYEDMKGLPEKEK